MVDDMKQDRNAAHFAKFLSYGIEEVVLVVVILLGQNHDMQKVEIG